MRARERWLAVLLLATLALGVTAACSSKGQAVEPASPVSEANGTPSGHTVTGEPTEAPPKPAKIDPATVELIGDWTESKVPRYPGANLSERSAEGGTIKNAGTIVADTPDSTEQVMAFYRGAMAALGWKEARASATQAVFETDQASLTISLVRQADTTLAMLQLFDR